jgi:hypothetical protein
VSHGAEESVSQVFGQADELGPARVIQVQDLSLDLKAVLVLDNVAHGPAIGGLRIAPDVSVEECSRLARAMTLKSSATNGKLGRVENRLSPVLPHQTEWKIGDKWKIGDRPQMENWGQTTILWKTGGRPPFSSYGKRGLSPIYGPRADG